MSGKWNWAKQWNAQRGRCWLCLKPMLLDGGESPDAVSEEHIVPRSRGGKDNWRNKLLAHRSCNSLRGAPFVWVKLPAFRRAAMKRIREMISETTVEGIDLGSSYRHMAGAKRRSVEARRLAACPSVNASGALRVTLAELSSIPTRHPDSHPDPTG
jgi:hypothetical protein